MELSTTSGTKATASKAKISNVDYNAMKLGSSGNAGSFYVNLPANTTTLTLHAAAWNGKSSNKLTLSSETAGVTISPSTALTLTANSGVSGTSTTYTITPNNTKEFFTFTLTGATSGAKIKLACTERCLIWGVNAETTGDGETPGEGGDDSEEPGTDDDCVWQLVTSASNLKVGDEIVIAAKDYNYALSTTQNNNNRGKANITKNQDQTITFGGDVQIITLEEGVSYSGTYVFYAGTGYLYAAGANSNNYLRTSNQKIANGDWEIEITNGTAVVTAQGSASRNILKYNNNSGIFSCYASDNSMQDIVLYKKVCAVAQTYSVKKGTLENCTLKFSKTEDNFTNDELTGLVEKDYVYFTITPSSGYELKGEPVVKDASDNNVECVEEDGVWMFEMPASDVTVSVSCVLTVKTYKVTFNANGHGTAPTAQNVEENKKATEPTEPSATGYTFDGWYTDQACSDDKKFDFNTPITEDITLYAKWTINQYTVTLNPNYPDGKTGTFTDKDGNSVNKIELKYDYNTASMNLTNLYEEIKLEGYQFDGWYSATSGGSHWIETGVIKKNVTVYAQWSKLYTITLSENGITKELEPQTATSYTLPTGLSAGSCQDDTKEFVGWSTVAIPTPGDKPTSKYHELGETVTLSTDETTFYAVFATVGGATVTKTITLSPPTTTSGYKTGTKTDSEGNTWSYYAAINNQSGTYEFGLNADDKNYHIASPEFAGVVTSVSFKARNGSSSESRKFLFCSSNSTAKPSTGDLAEVIIPKSEQYNNTYTADLSASSVSQFYIYTPKALGITNISVTYTTSDGVSYSDYVTSCSSTPTPDPVNSDWVLTPLADITCNDLVVITMKNSNGTYALTNGNGTSDAPKATEVEIANDKLKTEPSEILQWVVMNNNGELTIHPVNDYNSWLYCFNDNDGVRVADKENKVFIVDKNSGYLYNQSTARYLGVYNNSEWRCYTTVNNNIKEQTLAFYVKKDANPNPCEEPVGDIESVATFIFNTAEGLEKLGITNVESSCNISEGHKFIQEGITMTNVKNGSTSTRVWSLNSGSYDLRMYKKAVFKLSAPQGHNIRKIVFDGENIQSITADNGVLSQKIWTGKQQEVVFTIADDAETVKIYTISVAVDYTRDVTLDEYGTICIPYGSNNYTGAKFYEVSWLKEGLGLYLDELAANAELVAGKPYIFRATSDEIEIICTGEAVINPVDGVNGLTGTFTKIEDLQTSDPSNTLEGNYMIADNKIWLCGTSCWLNANRAYIKDSKLPKTEQAKIPGRRRVCMGENTTTDFENITNGENNTIKVIENGQLFIIRNGEKFNAQGQKL